MVDSRCRSTMFTPVWRSQSRLRPKKASLKKTFSLKKQVRSMMSILMTSLSQPRSLIAGVGLPASRAARRRVSRSSPMTGALTSQLTRRILQSTRVRSASQTSFWQRRIKRKLTAKEVRRVINWLQNSPKKQIRILKTCGNLTPNPFPPKSLSFRSLTL